MEVVMKPNEAPEKIYISPLPNHSDGYVGVAWDEPHKTMVEYIRTDAFVEKAANWLRCHPSSHYDDLEEFANAFKKAMKLYD